MNAPQPDFRQMTADTMGQDLLSALVTELKLLPKPWPELTKGKQDDIIDRLRSRVEGNIKMAVHLLAAEGRIVVAGDLDQITIKDGVKAVVKFGINAPNLNELYEHSGKMVLVVVANPSDHTAGMDEIKGESDQRAMDLGHEYHDNDGGGMDVDHVADAPGLPAPGDTTPTEEELDKAYDDGYHAAGEGRPESDCPVMRGEMCIQWVKGWKDFFDGVEKATEAKPDQEIDPLYPQAVAIVTAEKRVSISMIQRGLSIGYNRAARLIESMEANGVISAADSEGKRTVLDGGERKAA